MPWGATIQEVVYRVIDAVPPDGKVLDLMCGPGYLLEQIHVLRPDISLTGIDLDSRYVAYASARNKGIRYVQADVRDWNTDDRYDGVLCTGSVHHLPYSDQPRLFTKLATLIKQGGFGICAEV
ncbi:MAG: class I SAM-dependent methyltransferase [Candidatus Moraniibacteriota bacterium]|nr:MAG: class I SAM-dependent methyltransferase [Candidatus Moranbacteria bacterium]